MPTSKELGLKIDSEVTYFTHNPESASYTSYSKVTTGNVVNIEGDLVWVYPPHDNDLESWEVQHIRTGEIRTAGNKIRYNQDEHRWYVHTQPGAGERFVTRLRGDDPFRFPASTPRHLLLDLRRSFKEAVSNNIFTDFGRDARDITRIILSAFRKH